VQIAEYFLIFVPEFLMFLKTASTIFSVYHEEAEELGDLASAIAISRQNLLRRNVNVLIFLRSAMQTCLRCWRCRSVGSHHGKSRP
jgi:hypothetical protein